MQYLVVARFNESLQWLDKLPDGWNPFVVYKDVDIPNVGREPSSYFYALSKIKYQPGDTIAFCQGGPFAHCEKFFHKLRDYNGEDFYWLGDLVAESDAMGHPWHPGIPVAETFERWYGKEPPETFWFGAGAQFVIPAEKALQYTPGFYEQMMTTICDEEETHRAPWCAERHWGYVWN